MQSLMIHACAFTIASTGRVHAHAAGLRAIVDQSSPILTKSGTCTQYYEKGARHQDDASSSNYILVPTLPKSETSARSRKQPDKNLTPLPSKRSNDDVAYTNHQQRLLATMPLKQAQGRQCLED